MVGLVQDWCQYTDLSHFPAKISRQEKIGRSEMTVLNTSTKLDSWDVMYTTQSAFPTQGTSGTLIKHYWIKRLESNFADVLEMYERQTTETIKLYILGGSLLTMVAWQRANELHDFRNAGWMPQPLRYKISWWASSLNWSEHPTSVMEVMGSIPTWNSELCSSFTRCLATTLSGC